MKRDWNLTPESFELLLGWLDNNRDQAGQKYEKIRTRLIKIFTCRGCGEADDLADETINRVTAKVVEIASSYSGDPALYFYGGAQKIFACSKAPLVFRSDGSDGIELARPNTEAHNKTTYSSGSLSRLPLRPSLTSRTISRNIGVEVHAARFGRLPK